MNKVLVSLLTIASSLAVMTGPSHANDGVLTFASYKDAVVEKTTEGGVLSTYFYAEKKGDAAIKGVSKKDGQAVLQYSLGKSSGSSWAGAAIRSTGAGEALTDLSAYKSIKLKLSAKDSKIIMIRILGSEVAIRDKGCYSGFGQKVTPTLTEYTIPLSSFSPGSWCGGDARSIKKSINNVYAVDVFDESLPSSPRESEFSVADISFVK
ncbi:MAG: hypothetical protein V4805_07875 [Pseudomonadota bacterium]